MKTKHLFQSSSGADVFLDYDHDGNLKTIRRVTDLTPVLENNKNLRNHNDGWSISREMVRVASIPPELGNYWLEVEGWDFRLPENRERLYRILNDPDWALLRTSDLDVGKAHENKRMI